MTWKKKGSRSTNKYGAVKVTVDGITFDSRAEEKRYGQLKILQDAGEIVGLTCHPRFELIPGAVIDGKMERGISYTADFAYIEHGKFVVEDVKGVATRDYELRKKMMLLLRGIRVREIDAKTMEVRKCKKRKGRTKSEFWTI